MTRLALQISSGGQPAKTSGHPDLSEPGRSGRQSSMANPFCSRAIQPGAQDFIFRDETTTETLLRRFAALQGPASIVGPHGCGKTTLCRQLARELSTTKTLCWVSVKRRPKGPGGSSIQTRQDRHALWRMLDGSDGFVVVDGFEQLSWLDRRGVLQWAKRRSCRLIVTAHRELRGIPVLWSVGPSLTVFLQLAARMQQHGPKLPDEVVRRCFERSNGNMREALFLLYDRFRHNARRG